MWFKKPVIFWHHDIVSSCDLECNSEEYCAPKISEIPKLTANLWKRVGDYKVKQLKKMGR